MDAETLVIITSVVAILVTAWGILETLRATLRQNSANIVLGLEKEYTIERRWARADLARRIQDSVRKEERLTLNVQDEPLLTWFENIGYLTRAKILDRGMVWNKFFWELERYYLALRAHGNLDELRKTYKCPTLYQELEWLYRHLLVEEERQNRSRLRQSSKRGLSKRTISERLRRMLVRRPERVPPDTEEINSFLAREANLALDRNQTSTAPNPSPQADG